ncbi:MAG TPA: GNAT family N-acetyltransferase [Actinospica sp.]|nr:GNAT family N-acetyltransferase [Actinospica sp.]
MNVIPQADVTRYGSYAELPRPILDDTLLLMEGDPGVLHGAWEVEGGYAFSSVDGYGGDPCWLTVVGSPESAARLIEVALDELGERCDGLTAPRGLEVARWLGGDADRSSEWDAMRCDAPPPEQPGEERVARVTDLAAVQAFLDRVNPHHSVRADHREVECWLGVAGAGPGELLAVGAFTRRRHGTAYLASIATAPEARGQGLGAAITAALTRRAFASGDVLCTLAHYHPNDAARRIYLRLGYRTTHQSQSGELRRVN